MAKISLTVKDTKGVDHFVFKASNLEGVQRWEVQLHDRAWPSSKTLKYETSGKGVEKEENWNTLQLRLRPRKKDRQVAWRARAVGGSGNGDWTEWKAFAPERLRAEAASAASGPWERIFAPLEPMPAPAEATAVAAAS